MGKSLEFVKKRIKSGETNGMENNKYDWMEEVIPQRFLKELLESPMVSKESTLYNQEINYSIKDNGTFKAKIIYDPNAEYDYFTMNRCASDGTYIHFDELMEMCIGNIINLKTCSKKTGVPKDLSGHTLIYTIGDFVLASETDKDKFKTEDKPWLACRFSAMLPIKYEVA